MTSGPERDVVVAGLLESASRVLEGLKLGRRGRGVGQGDDLGSAGAGVRIVGVGWATVDIDRATAQFSASLGLPASAWLRAQREAQLGAEARLGPALGPDGPRLLLLEPDSEGRLAASLARRGEGVAVAYVAGPDAGTTESTLSTRQPGPLGPARLVLGGPAWGPHVVVVDDQPESLPSAGD